MKCKWRGAPGCLARDHLRGAGLLPTHRGSGGGGKGSRAAQGSAQLSAEALVGLSVQTTAPAPTPCLLLPTPQLPGGGTAAGGASGLLWRLQPGQGAESLGPAFSLKDPHSEGIGSVNVEYRRSPVVPHNVSTSRWCGHNTQSVETAQRVRPSQVPGRAGAGAPVCRAAVRAQRPPTLRRVRAPGGVRAFTSRPQNAHPCALLPARRGRRELETELRPPSRRLTSRLSTCAGGGEPGRARRPRGRCV